MDIIRLAKAAEYHKLEYQKALKALTEALTSAGPSVVSRRRKPRSGPSISQQVLDLIKADPDGLTRGQILEKIPNPGAVHSALKKHKAEGLIDSVDGRWQVVKPRKVKGAPITP